MRILAILVIAMAAACASAQVVRPSSEPTDPTVDAALDLLKARGEGLKDFVADVTLTRTDQTAQSSMIQTGKVWYQTKGNGDARLRVTFDKRGTEKKMVEEKLEYLLDDGWLWDRDYRKTNQVKRQVAKPGDKINLFQLGQGPFPLPIGQDKEQVHAQFEAKKGELKDGDPADTVHLVLTPRTGTKLAKKFTAIDVWVAKDGMPARVSTMDLAQETEIKTDLTNVKVNKGVADGDFVLPKIDEAKWQLHEEEFGE